MPSSEIVRPIAARSPRSIVLFIVLSLCMLAADLVVKHLSFEHVAAIPVTREHVLNQQIPPHNPVNIVPKVLSLKLTINHGAVFGLGAGGRYFFIAVTFVAIAVIITIFLRSNRAHTVLHVGLALVLAGALGNLYDRMYYGAVRDMLYLFPGVRLPFGLNWPGGNNELYPWIFNVADVALCVGVGLILLVMMRSPPPAERSANSQAA